MNISSFNTILFDFDGTLFDSGEGIINSLRHALEHVGLPTDRLNPQKMIGPLISEGLKSTYPEAFQDAAFLEHTVQTFRKHYHEFGVHQCKIYEGIEVLLKKLNQLNKTMVIATAKPTLYAEQILTKYQLKNHFSVIVGNDINIDLLSKTEIIAKALSQIADVNKKNMIMIGDRYHDIVGARENGLAVIGVTYGYGTREELMSHAPDYIVENVSQLSHMLLR